MNIPASIIIQSNARLWRALVAVRLSGRSLETMGEVRDALNQRRRMRADYHAIWQNYFQHLEARLKWDAHCREIHRLNALSNATPAAR